MEAIGVWGATGGTGSGIGRAILRELAANRYLEIYVFGRSEVKLRRLAAEFPLVAGSLCWDLEDEKRALEYQDYLSKRNIRTIISTTGFGLANPVPFLSREELHSMVDANLLSPFMILKNSIVPMKNSGGGRIVSFGSITSIHPEEGAAGYSASKMAFRGMLEAARKELKNTFRTVSLHGVYTGNVGKVGIDAVVGAVSYAQKLPFGIHCDLIID